MRAETQQLQWATQAGRSQHMHRTTCTGAVYMTLTAADLESTDMGVLIDQRQQAIVSVLPTAQLH